MTKNNVLQFEGRETISTDTLTQLLKSGAQQMLRVTIEAEVGSGIHAPISRQVTG